MEFGKETIEKIQGLVEDRLLVEVGGQAYSAARLAPVMHNPKPDALVVHNLRGFCGFIDNDIDNTIKGNPYLIVVNDPKSVDLVSCFDPTDKKRTVLVSAKVSKELKEFPFGQFLTQEEFAIRFRSLFISGKNDDFEYILSYASKLTGGTEVEGDDDGITQKVTVRRGVSGALKEKAVLRPIVKLTPYRTFREAAQPESEFLFRVRPDSNDAPTVALFEADGGAWVNKATENVVEYIQSLVNYIPVIA